MYIKIAFFCSWFVQHAGLWWHFHQFISSQMLSSFKTFKQYLIAFNGYNDFFEWFNDHGEMNSRREAWMAWMDAWTLADSQ